MCNESYTVLSIGLNEYLLTIEYLRLQTARHHIEDEVIEALTGFTTRHSRLEFMKSKEIIEAYTDIIDLAASFGVSSKRGMITLDGSDTLVVTLPGIRYFAEIQKAMKGDRSWTVMNFLSSIVTHTNVIECVAMRFLGKLF